MSKPHFGYIAPEERTWAVHRTVDEIMQNMPLMTAAGTAIAGTGAGQVVLGYKLLRQVAGFYPMERQTIGDCVSHGWSKACMATYAADILERGEAEEWRAVIATEWLYGTGRVLVGRGRLRNSDGSIGVWQAEAVVKHGLLWRLLYPQADLRRYSGKRAKEWGYRDLPFELEETADETPVSGKPALVTSYEQVRDAIANHYYVAFCSNQGFTSKRDADGYCRASGRWNHCMAGTGVDDTRRPGVFIDNSWGNSYTTGPIKLDAPPSGFWVDAETIDRMARQNDSFAIPGVHGFRRRELDWAPW